MRFKNKYKFLNNNFLFYEKYSFRILKFKRPKWLKIKELLIKNQNRSFKLLNKKFLFTTTNKIERLKLKFFNNLKFKRSLDFLYDDYKKTIFLNNCLLKSLLNKYIKPLYKIDSLLKFLSFTKSKYNSLQYINKGCIYLNDNLIVKNSTIKQGDKIKVNTNNNNHYFLDCLNYNFYFILFEIDFYTKQVIILKNWNHLNFNEVSLLFNFKIFK